MDILRQGESALFRASSRAAMKTATGKENLDDDFPIEHPSFL